ncbi:MAG TPA: DUF1629 domain-containing protein [Lacipirellulaceae bacterium]|nr:DUF1629 domain-containing protein [Lacipirellulaceae bacterium]
MIDFEKHRYWDEWDELKRPFPRGVDTLPCEQLAFTVDLPDALTWHWYSIPGTGGVWSQRAKDLLWPYAGKHLRCFQTTLNGAPYYILRLDDELGLDCLDYKHSELNRFPSSGRVARILKYVFRSDVIHDPMVFHAKDGSDILCTESIHQMILDVGLKGFVFQDTATLCQRRAV